MNKLISVIVPIYNAESYIEQCIHSIINQTYKDIEILLIDDGSTDSSGEKCDKLALVDERIWVLHQKNGGVVNARNAGLNKATGNYIIFVDADDWIDKEYISTFAKAIQKYQADIICCGYSEIRDNYEEKKYLKYKEGYYDKKKIIKDIFPSLIYDENGKEFPPSLCTKAFKKSLLEKCYLNEKVIMGEDSASVIACVYNAKNLVIINQCLYHYIYRNESVTHADKVLPWDGPQLRANHIENSIDLKMYNLNDQFYRMIVHSLYVVARSQYNRKEKTSVISKDIREQLKIPLYNDAIKKSSYAMSNKKDLLIKYMMMSRNTFFLQLMNQRRKGKNR